MLRAFASLAPKLALLLMVLIPGACHLTNQAEQGTLGLAGDSSWTAHDRLIVVLEDARGADTLFDGRLPGLDTLARLPAGGYGGGQAVFIIQGFQDGELVYEEHRSYDGSRQQVVVIDIPFDRKRVSASPDLDLRPDQVRLYLGGDAVDLETFPAALRESGALTWKTGNPAVATVSQAGVISPVGVGATYVQAAAGDTLRDASAVRVVRDVPVVNAGAPDTTVPAGTAVIFHVTVSQEYGDVAVFAWDLNGDDVYDDSLEGTAGQTGFATPSRTFGTGEVTVRFRVRDSEGNLAEASKRVRVAASAPKIDSLGARPLVVSIKDTVAFAALVTGNGAELRSFAWDFDGDGTEDETGSLDGERAPVAGAHAYPQPALYQARLRITDGNGVAISSELSVTVKLDPPFADAGANRTVLPGAQVRLQGIGRDSLGEVVAREWKCGPAEFTSAGDSGVHVFTAPSTAGSTSCVFQVTDDDGLTAVDSLKVVVDEADAPSIPAFTPEDTTLSIRDSVVFLATVAAGTADLKAYGLDIDGDGRPELQGSLSGKAGEIRIGRRFPTAGTFDIALTVEDQAGKTTMLPARVVVLLDPPKASAGKDTTVVAGARVNLRGTDSDSLGTVVLREWKIGGGQFTRVTGRDTSFTASAAGTLVCTYKVTDDDGQTAEDIVEVTVSPALVADLSALTASVGDLAPAFTALTTEYTLSVPNATASLTVTPTAAQAGGSILVNGKAVPSGTASGPVTLGTGATVITILVTAQDTSVKKSYSVTVNRGPSVNADLSALTASVGTLAPAFAAQTTGYTLSVPNATTSLTVTPTAAQSGATLMVNGTAVASGTASAAITLGTNTTAIIIRVTAQDTSVKKTYTVTVNRGPSPNADLSALTTSAGTLAPAFAAATTAYAVSVPNATTSLTVTPTSAHAAAAIQVNGTAVTSGTASGAVALAVGTTAITIRVTAQDTAVKKTYTVTVTRATSSNADLSALTSSVGTLAPAFAAQTTGYTLSVPNATTSLTVTPTAAHASATLQVNGTAVASGTASAAVTLGTSATVITIRVTAQDTSVKKSYTVTVNRGPSPNADLSALTTSVGTLAPAFAAQTIGYAVSVPNATASLTVTPTAAHAAATLLVNGTAVTSGTASGAVALAVGTTAITIRVTAQDTAVKKTYTVTVTRAASPNADLSALTASVGTLAPAFARATLSYSVSVTATSIRLTPTVATAGATVQVNGVDVASGTASAAVNLAVGANAIPVEVTAPDGTTTKTYTVNVTRISTDPSLSALIFPAGGSINPAFTSAGTAYTVTATAAMTAFTVRPTAAAAGATITVDGSTLASGSTSGNLAFPIGNSTHTIVVTAPDGATTRTYTLTVVRPVPRGMRFGYAMVDDYRTNHRLTVNVHNPGGVVDYVRDGRGHYTMHFRGLVTHGGAPGIVHATAHTDASLGAYCKVAEWSGDADLTVLITCFDMGGGAIDAKVSVLVLFPRNGADGQNASVLADQPSQTSPYEPVNPHTYSSGGDITIDRRTDGDYHVHFVGLGGPNGGTPMITAVGTGNIRCQFDAFTENGDDLHAYVKCMGPSGQGADAPFSLSVMQPYSGTADGVAVALIDGSALTATHAFNNGNGSITTTALSTGQWQVTFGGLGTRGATRGGNVQVSTRTTSAISCQAGAWTASGANLTATVKCFDNLGGFANPGEFMIWVMK